MASDNANLSEVKQPVMASAPHVVTAILPARNEEAMIAACIESFARQPEIAQILVVNDESSDATADVVRRCMKEISKLRLLQTKELPDGRVRQNHALRVGVQQTP